MLFFTLHIQPLGQQRENTYINVIFVLFRVLLSDVNKNISALILNLNNFKNPVWSWFHLRLELLPRCYSKIQSYTETIFQLCNRCFRLFFFQPCCVWCTCGACPWCEQQQRAALLETSCPSLHSLMLVGVPEPGKCKRNENTCGSNYRGWTIQLHLAFTVKLIAK